MGNEANGARLEEKLGWAGRKVRRGERRYGTEGKRGVLQQLGQQGGSIPGLRKPWARTRGADSWLYRKGCEETAVEPRKRER